MGHKGSDLLLADCRALEHVRNSMSVGTCGSPATSLGGGINWSRDWNLTLPDVGVGLLLHQPFNYSHNKFTVRLQHSSLTPREEQAQTLNELISSFPTNEELHKASSHQVFTKTFLSVPNVSASRHVLFSACALIKGMPTPLHDPQSLLLIFVT